MAKQKIGGGNSKKGRQSAHNKAVGKYTKQRLRTEKNKRKKWQKYIENNPNASKEHIKKLEEKIRKSRIGI